MQLYKIIISVHRHKCAPSQVCTITSALSQGCTITSVHYHKCTVTRVHYHKGALSQVCTITIVHYHKCTVTSVYCHNCALSQVHYHKWALSQVCAIKVCTITNVYYHKCAQVGTNCDFTLNVPRTYNPKQTNSREEFWFLNFVFSVYYAALSVQLARDSTYMARAKPPSIVHPSLFTLPPTLPGHTLVIITHSPSAKSPVVYQ